MTLNLEKHGGFIKAALLLAALAALSGVASAQSQPDAPNSRFPTPALAHFDFYTRPTEGTKIRNYFLDGYSPYPITVAAATAAVDQIDNSPPEWNQGAAGYGKRFASDFGISAVSVTTHYALAEAFREDTLYYRCTCKGAFHRLGHALTSTFTSRRGDDGHRVFSFSALVAPYAGIMTAVYGWYPGRYNAMDGFRMGNYSLLSYAVSNVTLEFFHAGPRSWISRIHLNNAHAAPDRSSF